MKCYRWADGLGLIKAPLPTDNPLRVPHVDIPIRDVNTDNKTFDHCTGLTQQMLDEVKLSTIRDPP
jgi:hypothetical protein